MCEDLGVFLKLTDNEQHRLLKQLSSSDRPEQTSTHNSKVKSLQDFNWSDSESAQLREYCDKEMKLQNYSYGTTYYKYSGHQGEINE